MCMKTFEDDFFYFYEMLKKDEHFSFSKYADGEYAILINRKITNCDHWTYNPETDQVYREELLDSFKYNEKGYYVGISCPCCVPMEDVLWMRNNVGVFADHLTWANIWVNGNYRKFINFFIPEFRNHKIIMIATEKGNPNNLPFKVEQYIPITGTAWKDNFNLVKELSENNNNKDVLYLFCAGPLGNMLAAKMWKYNKENTYIDIGSTLNPWLVGNNRGYLNGSPTLNKICIW